MLSLLRLDNNPILLPNYVNDWEKRAAFNPSVVKVGDTFHMVYRALSSVKYYKGHSMSVSTIGYAQSTNGEEFVNHRQLIVPEYPWEIFGCEDPRVTYLDGKFYIFYTALSNYPFNADGIKVGLAITRDFHNIDFKTLVTPFNAKAMALFPRRIDNKLAAVLTANTDRPPAKIALAFFDKEEEIWSEDYWKNWYAYIDDHSFSLLRDPSDQVEVGSVPVATDDGWILIHSYIKNYMTDHKIFGIEAALMDLKDPKKLIGRSQHPLLIPEMDYEKYGDVPNIVFPSGALIHDEDLYVYYGAADTSGCLARCDTDVLLHDIIPQERRFKPGNHNQVEFTRFEENPILTPLESHAWESKAVFNPASLLIEDKVHLLYRAISAENVSVIGYAVSQDGLHIDERLPEPVYTPRETFEKGRFGAGCEDPRITKIGERFYMLYTAYDGVNPPRVALTSISVEDFKKRNWRWAIPQLISPPDTDDKDACIFPRRINGRYAIIHRLQKSIWIDYVNDLLFYEGNYLGGRMLMQGRLDKWDNGRIGIASVPIETRKGWILLYHGIDDRENHTYKVGAALLELHNPENIISRLDYPVFEPETTYEKIGQVPNVVFPCGSVVRNGKLFIYYGGADSTVGVATIEINNLLKALLK